MSNDIETQIINFLKNEKNYIGTLKIAKVVCGKRATKKDVNKYLYSLQSQKVITKISEENGGNPRWKLIN